MTTTNTSELTWGQIQTALEEAGVTPNDFDEVVNAHPELESLKPIIAKAKTAPTQSMLMRAWTTPIAWNIKVKHIVIGAACVGAVLGSLKLVGWYFNVDIPLLHSATEETAVE
jgi:hypothetical protein